MKICKRWFLVFLATALCAVTQLGVPAGEATQPVAARDKEVIKDDKIDYNDEEITQPESVTEIKDKQGKVLIRIISKAFLPPKGWKFKKFPNAATHVDIWANPEGMDYQRIKDTPAEIKISGAFTVPKNAGNFPLRGEGNLEPPGGGGGGSGGSGGGTSAPPPEFHWSAKVLDVIVDLDICNGQDGAEVPEEKEESVGAFTVANLNDTDGDGKGVKPDNEDDEVTGEKDLMRLILRKPEPDLGGKATLKVVSGKVKFWRFSTKQAEIKKLEFATNELPKEIWVEATDISAKVRDIEIEMEYQGVKDTVKATGVWAKKTDFKNKLTDALWGDAGDPLKRTFTRVYGGKFGIQFSTPPVNVQYAMGLEFAVYPSGIGSEPGVIFDITRQTEFKNWNVDAGVVAEDKPWGTFPTVDMSNDDGLQNDEDNTPEHDHIYSIDGVGEPNNGAHDQVVSRNNFYEFVRVRFDGASLGGNNSDGSRCSDKVKWHAFYWIEKDGNKYKQRMGKTNEVEERHLAVDPAPVP